MPEYIAHNGEAHFSVQLDGIAPDATEATFEILKVADDSVLDTLTGQIEAGCATATWVAKGPEEDGEERAHRVYYKVRVPGPNGEEIEKVSDELEVYNDWLIISSVHHESGDVVTDAPYRLKIGDAEPITRHTGTRGEFKETLLPPGDVTIEWLSWAKFVDWEDGAGTTRKAKIEPCKQAKLVWPANGSTHKQFVNLDADAAHPEFGNRIKVKVTLDGGKAGEKVFVKLAWDEALVSKRNDLTREVVGGTTADWCQQSGKEITLASDGEEVLVEIELGLAGGDTYTLSVGGNENCGDHSCTIVNWRRVWYEVMAPNFASLAPPVEIEGAQVRDLLPAHQQRRDALLHPCFVEYRPWRSHLFTEAEAPQGSVFDAAYFGGAAPAGGAGGAGGGGGKVYVLTDHTFKSYPKTWDNGKSPRSVGLKLCDRNYFNESGGSKIEHTDEIICFMDEEMVFVNSTHANRWMLPHSAHDGTDAVKEIRWEAQIDPAHNSGHPAVSGGAARSGTLNVTADVEFTDSEMFTIKFPQGTDAAPGPGRFVGGWPLDISDSVGRGGGNDPADVEAVQQALEEWGYLASGGYAVGDADEATIAAIEKFQKEKAGFSSPDGRVDVDNKTIHQLRCSATHCPVKVTVRYEAANEALGLSGRGAQAGENLSVYNPNHPQTSVDVIVHEFCHSAKMAVIGGVSPPPGLPTPKTTADADGDNEDTGSTKGHLYTDHGHSGGHCARGLTDAQKGLNTYAGGPEFNAATCINFGANHISDPSRRGAGICVTCAKILKARELQSMRS